MQTLLFSAASKSPGELDAFGCASDVFLGSKGIFLIRIRTNNIAESMVCLKIEKNQSR